MDDKQLKILFDEIVNEHKGILFKVARTYCKEDAERQDLVQEILVQVWQSLHRYKEGYKLTTWLYRVALNVAISFYRKAATREKQLSHIYNPYHPANEPSYLEKEEKLALLEKFIDELNELDKALILLYLEQKAYKEIAEILGITETNVATKLSRIKVALKQKFDNQES